MLYEDKNYETILSQMLDRVREKYPNLDTREGSIIFNANAPSALEMAILYTELDNALNECFVDTASREFILRHCDQMGIDISAFEASAGTHKGLFNTQVEIGSRWNCDLYNYEVTEYLGVEGEYHAYKLLCETKGATPNNITGDLVAITNIPDGLNYAVISECLIEGENETSDEDIKTEYYNYVRDVQTDGNIAQYEQWCREFNGIGNYKIIPQWNGVNTVKVSILSASNQRASDELIASFQEYLDPGVTGMGDGKAPIGAFVTVSTATRKLINVSATVKLADGYTNTDMVTETVKNYFKEIAYKNKVLSYMSLGAEILKTEGVESIKYLEVNSGIEDIVFGDEEIPELWSADWAVED